MKELIEKLEKLKDKLINSEDFEFLGQFEIITEAIQALQQQENEWIELAKFKPTTGEDFLIKFENGEIRRYLEDNLPTEVITHCKKF